jgi:DHA1 family bicyclomycin/chloramphenicol resistance-like MFS transporter
MPSLVDYFATTETAVEFTFTAYIWGLAIGQLIYGPLSDHWGRRPVLLVGLAAFTVTSLLVAFSPTIGYLALGRFVQAVSAGAGGVLSRAIVRDLMGPERTVRAIAFVTMATTLSPAVGPLVGGQFEHYYGWSSIFLALTAGGLALMVWCALVLPETRPKFESAPPGVKGLAFGFVKLVRTPAFLAYSFNGGFQLACQLVFFGSAPFLLINLLGISPRDYGLYTVAGVVGFMSGNFIVTRNRDLTATARMALTGSLITLLGTGLMLTLVGLTDLTVWTLIGPFTIVTLGSGIALPNAVAGSLNRYPEIAGTSSSLSGFLGMATAAIATALLGLVHATSALPTALFMFVLSALAVMTAFLNPERRATAQKESAPV